MRLSELFDDSTKLEYHDTLNPALWDGVTLKDAVATALLKIADNFKAFLNMDSSKISDIVITGSNCNYNWSKLSDVDLHLVADFDANCLDCAGLSAEDCLRSKKTLWNDGHDVDIYGYPVEVYVQTSSEHPTSNAGIYSLVHQKWIQEPTKEGIDFSNNEIIEKAKPLMDEIDNIVDTKVNDESVIQQTKDKIWQMRGAGLQSGGEYSLENLAFKTLRNLGYLEKLKNYEKSLEDSDLSLN